jgi:hypothetical protein
MKDFVLAWNGGIDLDSVCDHLIAALSTDSMQDRTIALKTIQRLSVMSLFGNDRKWHQLSTAILTYDLT